jgi:hypothetical protein
MSLIKTPVYMVHQRADFAQLALGLLITNARRHAPLASRYEFHPTPYSNVSQVARAVRQNGPGIVVFSHYAWTTDELLAISRRLKRAVPEMVTVHGGPSVPKYTQACADFMAKESHVDIAVHGEGEGSFVGILERLADSSGRALPESLEEVNGIAFRAEPCSKDIVRTGDAGRLSDLNVLPSPYLEGFFDNQVDSWLGSVLETNRGCPYGCSFCDWGSSTLQKIRQFDIDRVKNEIDWMGKRNIETIFLADSNFGIFPRDVELAEHIVRTKEKYGFPRSLAHSFAKNATDRVVEISRMFVRAGLTDAAHLDMQSTVASTLTAINRSNIKTARYIELREAYEEHKIPISITLMMGLPGQTVDSHKEDLEFCFDQWTHVRANQTQLLPNSPMADPIYMKAHGIKLTTGDFVVETSTCSAKDMIRMKEIFGAYTSFVSFALLKYVLRYVKHEYGVRVTDFLQKLIDDLENGRPGLDNVRRIKRQVHRIGESGTVNLKPIILLTRWQPFYDEIANYLNEEFGVPRDSAMESLIQTQIALIPKLTARYPMTVNLRHDVAAYVRDLRATRQSPEAAAKVRLSDYKPGSIVVSDPHNIRLLMVGTLGHFPLGVYMSFFELSSALTEHERSNPYVLFTPEKWTMMAAGKSVRKMFSHYADFALRILDSRRNLGTGLWSAFKSVRDERDAVG